MGPMHWIHGWGLAYGIYPWGSALVMEDLMGRHLWVGCSYFSWGVGGGEEELQGTTAEAFSQDDASSKQPCLCYILYIAQWKFRCSMRQTIANGVPDPRCPGQVRALFRLREPVDLVHTLKTVKGLLLLVPSRTPRSSGYDVYADTVYVVICYMSYRKVSPV